MFLLMQQVKDQRHHLLNVKPNVKLILFEYYNQKVYDHLLIVYQQRLNVVDQVELYKKKRIKKRRKRESEKDFNLLPSLS